MSVITAVGDRLGLKTGDAIAVVIKATEVMIAK